MNAPRAPAETVPEAEEWVAPSGVWAVMGRLDAAVEELWAPLRARPALDTVAAVISNLADYGFVWATIAVAKGRHGRVARRRATRALAVAGISSYSVNAAVKRLVDRQRPKRDAAPDALVRTPRGLPVRVPTSSSFPSGHTLAAACTAVLLADGPAEGSAYLGFAGAVAASRLQLRDHHASDVLAGLAIGAALGAAERALVRRLVTLRLVSRRPG